MDRWYWDEEEMYRVDKYGSPVDSCKNMDVEWYKADEVDARFQELVEEVSIYKDLCTAYRVGDYNLADKALSRLEALKEK